ncbi:MAG: ribose 5-phosphate isomerase B [Acidimicrobiales bacterium]|nr:ribose 5-phosphate isomerase B [Acidimicrobiales bacterium]
MTGERSELESEVRGLVERVLAGVLDGSPAASQTDTAESGASGSSGERLAIGSDHGGFELKENLKTKLVEAGWTIEDCGTDSTEACDYPVFAHVVARQVAKGNCVGGIMIDGAGIGSAMAANKVPGVRAAACYDISTARNSREHNRANVLTLGAGLTGSALAWQIVQEWLATPWGRGRHHKRVTLITEIESTYIRSEA